MYNKKYDIIVIGAGHAGCEAALSASRMGCSVLMFAIDLDKLASMPCSPSIGGMAKGQLVKEIDALGGEMAKITDKSAIQYKTLNTKKGPAVHSSRTQNDKNLYHRAMKSVIEKQKNLDLKQAMITSLIIENRSVCGVLDNTGFSYQAKAVILATGTFLSGRIHIGLNSFKAGRQGECASYELAAQLKALGFKLGKMKTGTPPRLDKDSIDFSKFQVHRGDFPPVPFSHTTEKIDLPQFPSYIGHTNEISKKIIQDNIGKSPLYSGAIKGISARYCPSFEDKVMKFPERDRHQVILEPEGIDTSEIYASGLGNSMPAEVQIAFVRSVKGLENAEIMRPAYAIEYDYINPVQLMPTLETKLIPALFMAGQINGTSGYEEAAAQGIWAGINAACVIQKREPFILDRSQAYMGVMIDDLVTRGTTEPYRMFTSRAEYRLLLREDNADLRLAETGYNLGLVNADVLACVNERKKKTEKEIKRVCSLVVKPENKINDYLQKHNTKKISNGIYLDSLLKRSVLDYDLVNSFFKSSDDLCPKVIKQVTIEIKYKGYIDRQAKEIGKFKNLEKIKFPEDFDYSNVSNLSNELKEKLLDILPASLGQASRIEGITPAALSVLMIAIKSHKTRKKQLL